MRDLFLTMENLESRRFLSVDIVFPGLHPSVNVEQGDVSIQLSTTKVGTVLSVETPGTDFTRVLGPDPF